MPNYIGVRFEMNVKSKVDTTAAVRNSENKSYELQSKNSRSSYSGQIQNLLNACKNKSEIRISIFISSFTKEPNEIRYFDNSQKYHKK